MAVRQTQLQSQEAEGYQDEEGGDNLGTDEDQRFVGDVEHREKSLKVPQPLTALYKPNYRTLPQSERNKELDVLMQSLPQDCNEVT